MRKKTAVRIDRLVGRRLRQGEEHFEVLASEFVGEAQRMVRLQVRTDAGQELTRMYDVSAVAPLCRPPRKKAMAYVIGFVDDRGRSRKATFTAAGRRRVPIGGGEVLVNADLRLADGTTLPAVLVIDEMSSGEHCGTYFLLPDRIVEQGEDDVPKLLGKPAEAVFPYRYRYRAPLSCHDHHVGDDGWSV